MVLKIEIIKKFFSKKENSLSQHELEKLQKEHDEKYYHYDSLELFKKDNKLLIKTFCQSEKESLKYKIAGGLYPLYHYLLKPIAKSKLKGFSDDEIFEFYFYMLKAEGFFCPCEKHFEIYKEAFKKWVVNIKPNIWSVSEASSYLFFDTVDSPECKSIDKLSYEEFLEIYKFIYQANTYEIRPRFESMLKKSEKFKPFLDNELLMQRICEHLYFYSARTLRFTKAKNKHISGASYILLLLSEENSSKEALFELHDKNATEDFVKYLANFYKNFQDNDKNKKLLDDLYAKYPQEWIEDVMPT